MTTFAVQSVWNLGQTIHVIGTVQDGVIKGGEVLHDNDVEIIVASVALGGGRNLPPGSVTLVVESLPCPANQLTGRTLSVVSKAAGQ